MSTQNPSSLEESVQTVGGGGGGERDLFCADFSFPFSIGNR